jgi:hypothetical protein
MSGQDVDTDENGNVAFFPLTGYATFTPYGMACGLRVEYAVDEAGLRAGATEAVQLIMQPVQAREVAQALLRAAEKAEQSAGGIGQ